jgi:hypothetical protein
MGFFQSIGHHLIHRVKAFVPEVIDTTAAKIAQGAGEVSNGLNHQATSYSPYTADNAYRARFQSPNTSRGMER